MHTDYRKWEAAIEDWQQPILRDETLPEWWVQCLDDLFSKGCYNFSVIRYANFFAQIRNKLIGT
jgi:hypothetical protein